MKSLVSVASNALVYKGPPFDQQTDTIFFASAGYENRETKIRTDQNGSKDELDVSPVHNGQQ